MPNISISPSSLEFIDSLYDDSLTVRRLLQMVADCAENASNANRGGEPFNIDNDSLYGTIDHAIRMLESIDDRTQQLWKEVCKNKSIEEGQSLSLVENLNLILSAKSVD